jgi:quercetin dioxygenase-like cupin family protein
MLSEGEREMPAIKWNELKEELIEPEFCSATGTIVRAREIEVGRIIYPAGTEIKPHALPNEQIHTVTKGKATFRIGEEEREVGPGEALLIRPQTTFSALILQEFEILRFKDVGPGEDTKKEGVSRPSFFKWDEMKSDYITPRYSSGRGPTITGERIEVAFMKFPAGTEGKPHTHPNEQMQVPLAGKGKYLLEEEHVSTLDEVILIPANLRHGVQILEDYTVVNCKNIVQGWSVYNAQWEK